jgi:hypothetical protein
MSARLKKRVPATRRNTNSPPQTRWRYVFSQWVMMWLLAVFLGNVALAANLAIEPTSHDFGSINVDTASGDKTFTLLNESDNPLQLDFIDVFGNVTTTVDDDGNVTTAFGYQTFNSVGNPIIVSDFVISDDACSGEELGVIPDSSAICELAMRFEPREEGTKTLNISIPYMDEFGNPTSLTLPLFGKGTAIPIPNIEASIMSHDFGDVIVGESSDIQTIRLSNTGEADLVIDDLGISGDAEIVLLSDFDFCSGETVSQDQNCSIRVQFNSTTTGEKEAILSVPSNDPDTPTLEISLTGEAIEPNISVEPMPVDFGEVRVGNVSQFKTISVYNTGNAPLRLGQISSLAGSEFERLADVYTFIQDICSNHTISPSRRCIMNVRLNPQSSGAKTATLSIPSNDPDMPTVDVVLNGTAIGWCQDGYLQDFSPSPEEPDFGTVPIGTFASIKQSINTWAEGCDALQIVDITVTGTNASEFAIKNKECYDGSEGNRMYSNCRFDTVFTPASLGNKSAGLLITFKDATTKTIPLLGNAVQGAPSIVVSPASHGFGTVVIGHGASHQQFYVRNTGNVNLKLSDGSITGTHKSDFAFEISDDDLGWRKWGRCFHQKTFLFPGDQCVFGIAFAPISSVGSKQANVTIISNAPNTPILDVPLTGTAIESEDCSDTDVTIETVKSGYWATLIYKNGQWVFEGPSDVWVRRQQPPTSPIPTSNDVVRINAGHEIIGIPFVKVKKLCIADGGTLKSHEAPNVTYGGPLEIQATDYIENKGDILGKSAIVPETPGASILLKVGKGIIQRPKAGDWWWYSYSSGGPILNLGHIIAGDGGDGNQYGASGGNAIVLGRNTTSTTTNAFIKAGDGGDITGTQTGKGGHGGLTQIWGKLGGYGYLINSNGAKAWAGDGGNCNTNAGSSQTGGDGGNLWLVSLPRVFLGDSEIRAGEGGKSGCTYYGRDGWVRIEPNFIDLSGANTKIEGGNVSIFGGNDWTLDLSGINGTVITATGDITIAVGENGVVDMRGSTGDLFKTEGQVNIFANDIALDEDVVLSDVIDASDIVVGPSKILRDVSIVGPTASVGEPGDILPVNITLTNTGPEKDTYNISVTDTAGWTLGQLPSTFELEALQSVDLVLYVTLPSTVGATDMITVAAISQNDPEANATLEAQVSVTSKPRGTVYINQGIVNVPGIETVVDNQANVFLYATEEDGTIDLSNLAGSKAIIATNTITLAIGKYGFIDLRGNNSRILETSSKVMICADPSQIKSDVDLKTLVGEFGFCSPKEAYAVSLTDPDPSNLSKPEDSIVSLIFTLRNEGLKADTYKLSVKDSLGLPLTKLPPIKRLKGLASAELLLNVTMNSQVGQTEVVTVTAISQTEPSKKAIATVRITTTLGRTSTYTPSTTIGGGAAVCPSTGDITGLCSNRDRVLKGPTTTIQPGGSVSGGTLEGTVNNNGTIGQVTVAPGAVVKGSDSAKVTGRVTNKGEMSDFEFVGGSITCEGEGKFSGDIFNNSKVGGKFVNPRFAANASLTGGAIQGVVTGDPNGCVLLRNVTVKAGSQLKCVILGEGVVLGKNVTLIDVYLSTGVHLKNVKVSGLITGDSGKPALLENTTVQTGSTLTNVRIGKNVGLPEDVQLGENVRFNHRSAIPEGRELIGMLPELLGASLESMVYPRRADLSADVLEPGDGILPAINNLAVFKDNGWILSQDSDSGCLELTVEPVRACILPVSLKKAIANAGISVEDDIIDFLTDNGLDVQTQPALQAPGTLQNLLSDIALPELIVQANGNLRVSDGSGKQWFSARSNWWALEDANAETGLSFVKSPYGYIVAMMVFRGKEGKKWVQLLFPAVAYPEVLKASAKSVSLKPYGVVDFKFNDQRYCGVINYAVDQSTAPRTDTLQIESISDATGDGVEDIKLIYPSGEEQLMYSQTCD